MRNGKGQVPRVGRGGRLRLHLQLTVSVWYWEKGPPMAGLSHILAYTPSRG